MDKKVVKIKLNTIIFVIITLLIIIATVDIFLVINNKNTAGIISYGETDYQESKDNISMEFLKLENNKENIIYSPLSIKYALKMLSDGANGNTKTQIDNLVGRLDLTKYDNIDNVLSFANGIYIRDTYSKEIKEDYTDTLMKKYNAEINYDSFENANNVNIWIERKTLGIIKNMLNDREVQDSKMLLINALAIDMAWDTSFDTNDTQGETFYLEDGTEMTATTMNMNTSSNNISYYKDKNITALTIELQKYEDTQLEFIAIMPDDNLSKYIETMTVDKINDITTKTTLASNTKYGINISIPKFSFEYDLKLKEDLKKLGITDVFNPGLANLLNISDEQLYVDDALHKADIDFTEKGVKAAAVTVLATKEFSMSGTINKPEEVRIDKPFMFLIRDKKTKEIWFTGAVYEPNSWDKDKINYQSSFFY